jgi:D-lactate dehydrogenase
LVDPLKFNIVSCFVNDKMNARVLKTLQNQGVNLIALRCAGFNNVDVKTAAKLNFKVLLSVKLV